MSSPINPPQSVTPPLPLAAGPARPPTRPNGLSGFAAVAHAVSLQTIPTGPPPEVLEQMASAAQRHTELSAQGRELRFSRDAQSGRTTIEVRDRQGHVLKTISPAQALAVAAGAPLE